MKIPDSPQESAPQPSMSLLLRVGCTLGLGLTMAFSLTGYLVHGDVAKVVFVAFATLAAVFTGFFWYSFRLSSSRGSSASAEKLRQYDDMHDD